MALCYIYFHVATSTTDERIPPYGGNDAMEYPIAIGADIIKSF